MTIKILTNENSDYECRVSVFTHGVDIDDAFQSIVCALLGSGYSVQTIDDGITRLFYQRGLHREEDSGPEDEPADGEDGGY